MRGAIGRRLAIGAGSRGELRELEEQLAACCWSQPSELRDAHRDDLMLRIDALQEPPVAHPLPRPDRPALSQPRAGAGADHQGGDVLPDGRVGLDGRGAQGAVQALLHPAVPVPDAALREDRPRLHPPPHAGAGGRRGELLPRPRDRRHGGVERAGADGRDHQGALLADRMEHLRRAGERRRQLAPRQRPLPRDPDRQACCRCAATSPTCRWPRKSRTCGKSIRACRRAHPGSRCARSTQASQIYPVFRELFKKEGAAA